MDAALRSHGHQGQEGAGRAVDSAVLHPDRCRRACLCALGAVREKVGVKRLLPSRARFAETYIPSISRREATGAPSIALEDFLRHSDKQMYDPVTGIIGIVDRATIKLVNLDNSLAALHRKLVYLNLTDSERLRPGWDAYFMQLASLAAKRSNCMKRRVGCVLVREKRVIATGYNGAPRGLKNCNEGGCARCNGGSAGGTALDACMCLHAEENALLEAGRERVGAGATLYCDTYVTPVLG